MGTKLSSKGITKRGASEKITTCRINTRSLRGAITIAIIIYIVASSLIIVLERPTMLVGSQAYVNAVPTKDVIAVRSPQHQVKDLPYPPPSTDQRHGGQQPQQYYQHKVGNQQI